MASDEEEYVVYGTPLEREEDVISGKRKKQAIDQGRLRIASSSQEVFDENGRRRFHGAFTGGFSAGYYNTVGSKEGWVPQKFTSSRKKRAELAQQRAYDFMDDEEKAEQDSTRLATASDFDTFGFTAAEFARKEVAQELNKRPSAIPGILPDEIIVPVSHSIGIELLRKMGWRHGRAIGPKHIAASSDARSEGRKAMLAFAPCDQVVFSKEEENSEMLQELDHDIPNESEGTSQVAEILPRSTPMHVINPKKDRHGFGFDPFRNAPEFRDRQHAQETFNGRRGPTRHHDVASKPSLFRPNVGRMGSGFGIGALEELDEEDEDIYASGLVIETVPSDEEPHAPSSKTQQQPIIVEMKQRVLPGFRPALISGFKVELFSPPIVPPDFDAVHKFKDPLDSEKVLLSSEPAEVAPPEDIQLCKLIEGLATFVARSGQKLENLYMEKRNNNPMFEFLFEGNGHAYYKRRLWEEHRKTGREVPQRNTKETALDSVQRGQILGETPLHRSSMLSPEDHARLQSALSSSFTKSASQAEFSLSNSQPFRSDPSKQARFEQFLKDKYRGGLRNVQAEGRSTLTEWERAQETLEFEATCQNFQKTQANLTAGNASGQLHQKNLQAIMNDRFASQTLDKGLGQLKEEQAASEYPKREEQPWRPLPLLCRRFNLPDPYSGKPPPLPKPRSRTESFILLSNPPTSMKPPTVVENQGILESVAQSVGPSLSVEQDSRPFGIENLDHEGQVKTIFEKPVDLYKAIFSDDSDEEDAEFHKEVTTENKSAEAAQAALNRLEAGDFLASIGKELGLKVPPSDLNQTRRGKETIRHAEGTDVFARPSAGSQIIKEKPQKLHDHEPTPINNVARQAVEVVPKRMDGASEAAGIPCDYSFLKGDSNVEGHFNMSSKTNLEQSKQKATAISMLHDKHQASDSKAVGNKDQQFLTKNLVSSEESISEDNSDDSQKNRRSEKRRKKERKHSKSHKQRSGNDHKTKKRNEDNEHRSHKHHRHKSRK